MENLGSAGTGSAAVTAERPMRDLESIIEGARTTAERVVVVANRLRDMRRRLIGMDESKPEEPKVNEVVGSELSDLRITLRGIDTALNDIEEYVGNLENV